ncbi:C3HC zinc finger-like-domain-containing protein, partial [Mycena pura]
MSATKRKLADAFHALDQAVEPSNEAKRPKTSTDKPTTRSLYATLAKYGVKPKQANPHISSLSKSTPHLSTILSRAAARTRKALPFSSLAKPPPPLPPTAEYRPSSIPSFLARLETFKLATYANKPIQIDAVAAAKCGWINDGKDRLVCGLCSVSWVVAGREGMTKDAANALVEKQRVSLVDAHKDGCPWKTRQCDPSIYRVPLQAPSIMIRELKTKALVLDPIMQQIEVKHPLSAGQLASLRSAIHDFTLATLGEFPAPPVRDAADEAAPTPLPPQPSDKALLAAFFGWTPAPLPTERPRVSLHSRPSSRAASRAASRASSPFASTPQHPPLLSQPSAATSAAFASASTTALPLSNSSGPPTTPRQFLRRISSVASMSSTKQETTLLHCALCQTLPTESTTPPPPVRPQRQFDLLKEHRSYCPYVVRSTVVPSLAAESVTSPTGVLEGWRAVLAVVLRYGLAQRQREASLRRKRGEGVMEVDGEESAYNVEAMIATVKTRGGRELLKYVKGLL